MTTPAEAEPKIIHFIVLTMELVITLLKISEIGISLHTSAKALRVEH